MDSITPITLTWTILGFLFAIVLGLFAGKILDCVKIHRSLDEKKPIPVWTEMLGVTEIKGWLLGMLEITFFFLCILIGQPLAIGAWFAFKLGSKWQVWNHIVKIPEELGSDDPIENLRFRLAWSAGIFQRFLIGTLYNVICAAFGSIIAKLGPVFF